MCIRYSFRDMLVLASEGLKKDEIAPIPQFMQYLWRTAGPTTKGEILSSFMKHDLVGITPDVLSGKMPSRNTVGDIRDWARQTAPAGEIGRSIRDFMVELLAPTQNAARRAEEIQGDRTSVLGRFEQPPQGVGFEPADVTLGRLDRGGHIYYGFGSFAKGSPEAATKIVDALDSAANKLNIEPPALWVDPGSTGGAHVLPASGDQPMILAVSSHHLRADLTPDQWEALFMHELSHQ